MKFRNRTTDVRQIPSLNVAVAPKGEDGDEFTVTSDEAAGLILQCLPADAWLEPSDDDASAAVDAAREPAEATKPKTRATAKKGSE